MHLFSWSSGFWVLSAGGHFSHFSGQWWQKGTHTLFLSSESRGGFNIFKCSITKETNRKITKDRMDWNKICDSITVILELIALAWRAFATGVRCNPGAALPLLSEAYTLVLCVPRLCLRLIQKEEPCSFFPGQPQSASLKPMDCVGFVARVLISVCVYSRIAFQKEKWSGYHCSTYRITKCRLF